MPKSVLVIDDEISILNTLKAVLTDEGFTVFTANGSKAGLPLLEDEEPDAVLLDIWMPDQDGLDVLKEIRTRRPEQLVIMMSGHGNIETAVKATKLGAFDFIEKPLALERLLLVLKHGLINSDLTRENRALKKQVKRGRQMAGQSAAVQAIRDLIAKVAPTTGSVLITGEHGTGKELIAHHLHAQSNRSRRPFIEVNCAAIPEELIESELFGHEKGSFTGATQKRRGRFDLAHTGTLFLDEIGDMSLKTQAKVLRILQEQKFERVGGSETLTVDVRIVAATNKDLRKEIQKGCFREDLFYRLNVVPFFVPPLRERREDIRELAETFLVELAAVHGRPARGLSPDALRVLETYIWPGNVRELRNLIERLTILAAPSTAGADLPYDATMVSQLLRESPDYQPGESTVPSLRLREARSDFEKDFILRALKDSGGNVAKAAATLGIERTHLHRKIKTFGIEVKEP